MGASRVEATQTTSKPCGGPLEAGVPTEWLWSLGPDLHALRTQSKLPQPASLTKANKLRASFVLHKHFTAILLFDPPNDSVMSARNRCSHFIAQEAEAKSGEMSCPRIHSQ